MRRSSAVKLTLLPMLASAAVAAEPAAPEEPVLCPPGATEPALSPPGLTPTIDECLADPCNPRCAPAIEAAVPLNADDANGDDGDADDARMPYLDGDSWVLRGGFGHYFWPAGG